VLRVNSSASGEQFEITHGRQRVTVVEVGGGIRSYTDDDRDVLQPYAADAMCDGAHGAPLIPWPNRLGDGRYRFDGVDYQVALNEPEKSNAIHGFLRWRSWQAAERTADRVVMATRLHPLEGYPFSLDVRVAYALADDGLTVTTTAVNRGAHALPYGCGQHPYLSPGGDDLVDDCALQFEAATRITTDAVRQLPTGTDAVAGTEFDFSTPRPIGDLALDFAFTDLARDAAGRAWVRLTGRDGRTAALWVDNANSLIELCSGDTLSDSRRRRGLGSEPMTCPPNAFATGERVIRLEPGQSTTSTWGVQLV